MVACLLLGWSLCVACCVYLVVRCYCSVIFACILWCVCLSFVCCLLWRAYGCFAFVSGGCLWRCIVCCVIRRVLCCMLSVVWW